MLEYPPILVEEAALERGIYPELGKRLGEYRLDKRLKRQAECAAKRISQQQQLFPISVAAWKPAMLHHGLQAVGLYGRGYRNFLDIQIHTNEVTIPNLPSAFAGYRILHMSDLHIDLDPSLTDVIIDRLVGLEYDLCVITGDFRADTAGPFERTIAETIRLTAPIDRPIYATLGNHDFVEFVPPLERAGIQFLLNETASVTRHGQSIYLSGIDDSYTYETDDIQRASLNLPDSASSILLSHAPDVYADAAAYQYDLMLCGHTHGGQICLLVESLCRRTRPVPDICFKEPGNMATWPAIRHRGLERQACRSAFSARLRLPFIFSSHHTNVKILLDTPVFL